MPMLAGRCPDRQDCVRHVGLPGALRAGHPAADAHGYVKYPNVDPLIEAMDMREAQRTYEANLNVITVTRQMLGRTLDILKG